MNKITIFSIISLFIFGCAAQKPDTKVRQESSAVQQSRAQKAFEELEKETSPVQPAPKVQEKKPEPVQPVKEEPKQRPVIQEKESPVAIAEKGIDKKSYPLKDGKPVWFWQPDYDGYLGAIGIARKNATFQGYAGQKRLAKTMAQAELAKSIRVVINSEATLERTQAMRNDVVTYYRSKFTSESRQSAEEILNNAVIKDEFVDPQTGDLYVWLVIEK
jgi:hypothetical protein